MLGHAEQCVEPPGIVRGAEDLLLLRCPGEQPGHAADHRSPAQFPGQRPRALRRAIGESTALLSSC